MKNITFLLFILVIKLNAQKPFITKWNTLEEGISNEKQITIPTEGTGYNYIVNWGDGKSDAGVTGDMTHTYEDSGTYTVEISGDFPRIYFDNLLVVTDAPKILEVIQWGDIKWTSMKSAFYGCKNLTIPAVDAPDLSNVTSLQFMFRGAEKFNEPIDHWDVSNVTSMDSLFLLATSFNQNLNSWNVSNVVDMSGLFSGASSFNRPISNWDVSKVIFMTDMFEKAKSFNQPIGNWDIGNVTSLTRTFSRAASFNQPIGDWNVEKVGFMIQTFHGAGFFNQDIGDWDVSNVVSMTGMFTVANNFNQDIGRWNTGKVTAMDAMFFGAKTFNQDIGNWDVSQVTRTFSMFNGARAFNQDISGWEFEFLLFAHSMFFDAQSFDQNIGNWKIDQIKNVNRMFDESNMSADNYDKTLSGWASQSAVPSGLELGAVELTYCDETGRNILIDDFGWTIIGDARGGDCSILSVSDFNATKDLELSVYPNPTSEILYIHIPNVKRTNTSELQIFDMLGKTIYQDVIESNDQEIDVQDFPSGTYFIRVGDDIVKFVR